MSTLNFNAAEVEPSTGFDAIPAGKYQVIINESEMKPTKTGNGSTSGLSSRLSLANTGRKLWTASIWKIQSDAVRMAGLIFRPSAELSMF